MTTYHLLFCLFALFLFNTTLLATDTDDASLQNLQDPNSSKSQLAPNSTIDSPNYSINITSTPADAEQHKISDRHLDTFDSISEHVNHSKAHYTVPNLSNSDATLTDIQDADDVSHSTNLDTTEHQNYPAVQDAHSSEQLPAANHGSFSHSKQDDTDPSELAAQIADVTDLLRHNENLQQELANYADERDTATDSLRNAIYRKNALLKEKQNAVETREEVDNRLHEVYIQMPRYLKTLDILRKQSKDANRAIDRLRSETFWVTRQKRHLAEALRDRGLEQWVENSVKDAVSPFVSDALVQGTASVVEPMIDGIGRLAAANGELSKRMNLKLRERVPIVEKPFYAGFVTYIVLLFPTVLVISLVLKVKRGFSKLSLGHMVILGNFYFLLLSGGCFVATLLGDVDVLLTFRHHNLHMFDFGMVLHGIFFTCHVLGHVRVALQGREKSAVVHVFLLCTVGLHFFVHSYRHAMHNEDSHVDKRAYLFYTGIFFCVLYDLTVKQIRKSQDTKVMTLNNTSISSSVNKIEAEAAGAIRAMPSTVSFTRISFLSQHTNAMTVSTSAPRLRTSKDNPGTSALPPRPSQSVRSSVSSVVDPPRLVSADSTAARDL